jgi:hypothetical protein
MMLTFVCSKKAIKANGEIVNEDIVKMFGFT